MACPTGKRRSGWQTYPIRAAAGHSRTKNFKKLDFLGAACISTWCQQLCFSPQEGLLGNMGNGRLVKPIKSTIKTLPWSLFVSNAIYKMRHGPNFQRDILYLALALSKTIILKNCIMGPCGNKRKRERSYVNIPFLYKNKLSPLCTEAVSRGEGPTYGALAAATVTVRIRSRRSGRRLLSSGSMFLTRKILPLWILRTHAMNKAVKVSNACGEQGPLTSHHVGILATKN